jgi:hypothetical protein
MKGKKKEQPGKTESKIIRHVFRLPIEEGDNVSLEINDRTYEVINLGTNGIGILLDDEDSFAAGQPLENVMLHLDTEHLRLKGKVVHVSPREFQLICGIEFVQMTGDEENKMLNFLRGHRESLFGGK